MAHICAPRIITQNFGESRPCVITPNFRYVRTHCRTRERRMRQIGSLSLRAVLGGAVAVAAAMYYYTHLRRVSAVVRRAAFDIGSGYTKMLVADVRDGAIVGRVVLETEVKLAYKVDAQQSPDGSLSDAIQAEGLECFRRLTAKVRAASPKLDHPGLALQLHRSPGRRGASP